MAARNLETAVSIAPNNPELLGFLGVIYFKARNYENAEIALRCAVSGCSLMEQVDAVCGDLDILACDRQSPDPRFSGVQGLALEGRTLEYFYTYGSVLAFNNRCTDAEPVFRTLDAGFGTDAVVSAIVAEGRAICASAAP